MNIDGVTALVTGGAGGLGSAVVRSLIDGGASVVIADRDEAAGKLTASQFPDGRVVAVPAESTDESSMLEAIAAAERLGPLRITVCAHGAGGSQTRVIDRDGNPGPLSEFRETVDNYLVGTYNTLRLAAASMAKTDPLENDVRGVIVNTASIAAYEGQIGQASYAAAKAGVVGMTLVAARDLANRGIRVMSIAPGTMFTKAYGLSAEEAQERFGNGVPFPKRMGNPDEYGALVRHICENDYLNGETVRLDGALRFGPR